MTLRQFVERPAVRERLNPLLEAVPRPSQRPALLVPPSGKERNRAGMMGTAIDYALRFELGRRCPHALEGPWAAYGALAGGLMDLPGEFLTKEGSSSPWKIAAHILREAEREIRAYRRRKTFAVKRARSMACVALRLATLDNFSRLGFDERYWRDDIGEVDPLEADELVAMLERAPFDALTTAGPLLLNPTFGRYSVAVGGADADLVIGDTLLDFKATQDAKVSLEFLRQLCGYFLLARGMRQDEPRFPAIEQLGIYFPRFGFVWRFPATLLTSHPAFAATEQWFIQQAMRGRTLPVETLSGQPVSTWLRAKPTPLGPCPDTIRSTLPSEEVNRILMERAIRERARSHKSTR